MASPPRSSLPVSGALFVPVVGVTVLALTMLLTRVPYLGVLVSEFESLVRLFAFIGVGITIAETLQIREGHRIPAALAAFVVVSHFALFSTGYLADYVARPWDVQDAMAADGKELSYGDTRAALDAYYLQETGASGLSGYLAHEMKRPLTLQGIAASSASELEGVEGGGDCIGLVINLVLNLVPYGIFLGLSAVLGAPAWGGLVAAVWWYVLTGGLVAASFQGGRRK